MGRTRSPYSPAPTVVSVITSGQAAQAEAPCCSYHRQQGRRVQRGSACFIEQSRESYYDALYYGSQGWHEDRHDLHPWLNHFWGMLVAAYKEFEDRVGTIKGGWGGKSELVRAWVNGRVTSFKASEVAEALPGVSSDLIGSVLRQLRDEGAAKVIGQGRGARWRRK